MNCTVFINHLKGAVASLELTVAFHCLSTVKKITYDELTKNGKKQHVRTYCNVYKPIFSFRFIFFSLHPLPVSLFHSSLVVFVVGLCPLSMFVLVLRRCSRSSAVGT